MPTSRSIPHPTAKRVHLYLGDHEVDAETIATEETTMPDAPDIILTHLKLEAFQCIDVMDIDLPPSGLIFSGSKGIGKTAILKAMRALFKGVGVDASVIKLDTEECRLALNFTRGLQHLLAKRVITRDGTKCELLDADDDDATIPRAKDQFRAFFGERGLDDPIKLFQMEPKDRRRAILEAIPCTITAEDLTRWTGVSQPWNCEGNGHEVLARVRQLFADQRAKAGQACELATAAAQIKAQAAAQLYVESPETMSPDVARTHVAAAERELAVLHDRRKQAAKRESEAEGTRAKIAGLRAKAEELMSRPEAVGPSDEDLTAAVAELHAAHAAFEQAKLRLEAATETKGVIVGHLQTAKALELEATSAARTADELEAAIAHTLDGDGDPIAMQVAAAESAREEALALVTRAEATAKWRAAKEEAATADAASCAAVAEWERLEGIVVCLSKDAPAELSKRSGAIPGLEITTTDILYQRKNIDNLSDGEKLEFAVEVVKLVTTGAKVLIVDKIEALPPSLQPGFVRKCLEGGWALFGTKVADGDLEIIDCYTFAKAA